MRFRGGRVESGVAGRAVAEMARREELDEIDAQISQLFELVAEGLSAATSAFIAGDTIAAGRVVRTEVVIDELHRGTEELVDRQLQSLSVGMGRDELARVVLALRIVPELERSGDLVEHIATRASPVIARQLPLEMSELICEMGRIGVDLWRRVAGTFGGVDDTTADELRSLDDRLDDLHVQLSDALASTDLSIAVAIELGLVARFFERLGDHAVNVARRVDDDAPRALTLRGA